MEGSESEAIFNSLNLNPELWTNEVFNFLGDIVDDAFDSFHQCASETLKIEETDSSEALREGVIALRDTIYSVLETRLTFWKKHCLRHCFTLPEGFSLPAANGPAGESSMDLDVLSDREMDVELDALRNKIVSVEKETAELNRELSALERQSVLTKYCAGSINEALQLYEQHSVQDMFQELIQTASELRTKMERLKAKRLEKTRQATMERLHSPNGNLLGKNGGKGLFNVTLEELQEFLDDIKVP